MVPVLSIKVEIFVGTDIEDAAKEAAALAERLQIVVEFDFNTVHRGRFGKRISRTFKV